MHDSERLKLIASSAATVAKCYCNQSKTIHDLLCLRPCPSTRELGFAWAVCVTSMKVTIGKRRTERAQLQYATARNLFDAACGSSLNPIFTTETLDLHSIGIQQMMAVSTRKEESACSKELLSLVGLLATSSAEAASHLVDLALMGMTGAEVAAAATSAFTIVVKRTDLNFFEATRSRKLIAATPWSIAPSLNL